MVTVKEVEAFLRQYSKYVKTFKKAIHYEKDDSKNRAHVLRGWQWHDVETDGVTLRRLVVKGFIKVNSHDKRGTNYYRLNYREEIEYGLKKFMPLVEYEELRRKPWVT